MIAKWKNSLATIVAKLANYVGGRSGKLAWRQHAPNWKITMALDNRSQNYSSWALSFLADYIVNTHHVYLKENDDQIVAYARKIASVHGERHPEVIRIAVLFEKIATDMVAHLKEEEEVFFPALKRAEAARTSGNQPDARDRETIRDSLVRLHREHEEVGDAIHEIRRLANGFRIPEGVCNTFMLTYRKLDEFEEDLHKHVHLENNILFLKATQL